MELLIAGLSLGALGLIFGLLLGVTGRVFAVPENKQLTEVRQALPGANCGGCGYPGCDGFAAAVVEGKAPVNGCPVGGAPVAKKVAEIMGVEAGSSQKKVATVICRGGTNFCLPKYEYQGVQDCIAASMVSDGTKSCHYACLGLGTCATVCQFGAISIDERFRLVQVDRDLCTGCGRCVEICPKHVLSLQPIEQPVRLLCHANEKGRVITDNCKAGCFSCGKCVEACHFGAIEMVNNLPVIDMEKCVGCMMCAEACPTDAIWADYENRKEAVIDKEGCIGCGLCKKNCPFDAIVGERRQKHSVTNACTGCGQCVPKCPKNVISLRTRTQPRDEYEQMDAPVGQDKPVL